MKNDTAITARAPTIKLIKTKGKIESIFNIGDFIKKEFGIPDDRMYLYQQAILPAKIQGRPGFLARVFETAAASKALGMPVKDFDSLNEHPELILYDGYYFDLRRGIADEIHIEKRTGTKPSLLEQKMQDGTITELGMVKAPSTARKWLGGFGKFLMMGGFIVVIIVIVAIIIAISILSKGC